MKKQIVKLITIIMSMLILLGIMFINHQEVQSEDVQSIEVQCSKIDFTKYDALMIVAHPDDETIWGGNHLKQGNYFVLCLTNQSNEIRSKEFYEVMKQSNSEGLILNYPDKTNGKRDDWKSSKAKITEDIKYIIQQNDWQEIVTHNPDGEYGHNHHIMTNQIVTSIARQEGCIDKLYYFGKYIKKKQLKDYVDKAELSNPLSESALNDKNGLISIYSSQKKVMKNLGHMFPYENFISYNEWYNY